MHFLSIYFLIGFPTIHIQNYNHKHTILRINQPSIWGPAVEASYPLAPLPGQERARPRTRSIKSNSRASTSAAGPRPSRISPHFFGPFSRSFFKHNFQSNSIPMLAQCCLQLGIPNPPESIPSASLNFDAVLVVLLFLFLQGIMPSTFCAPRLLFYPPVQK